jgi:hypothetical protein
VGRRSPAMERSQPARDCCPCPAFRPDDGTEQRRRLFPGTPTCPQRRTQVSCCDEAWERRRSPAQCGPPATAVAQRAAHPWRWLAGLTAGGGASAPSGRPGCWRVRPTHGPSPPLPRWSPPLAPPAGRVLNPCWPQEFAHREDRFPPAIVDNAPLRWCSERTGRARSASTRCMTAGCPPQSQGEKPHHGMRGRTVQWANNSHARFVLVPLLGYTSLHGRAVRVPSSAAQRHDRHVTPHVSRPSA